MTEISQEFIDQHVTELNGLITSSAQLGELVVANLAVSVDGSSIHINPSDAESQVVPFDQSLTHRLFDSQTYGPLPENTNRLVGVILDMSRRTHVQLGAQGVGADTIYESIGSAWATIHTGRFAEMGVPVGAAAVYASISGTASGQPFHTQATDISLRNDVTMSSYTIVSTELGGADPRLQVQARSWHASDKPLHTHTVEVSRDRLLEPQLRLTLVQTFAAAMEGDPTAKASLQSLANNPNLTDSHREWIGKVVDRIPPPEIDDEAMELSLPTLKEYLDSWATDR